MYNQLSKELKASLFQRIKSPFFASYFISFLFINYRFIFLMLSNKSIDEKFQMIDEGKLFSHIEPISVQLMNFPISIDSIYLASIIYPFLFAILYISIIPYFEYYISMPIWKHHQNRLKEKHAELDKQEVFLGEEKSKYLKEILNIRKEKEQLVEELTNIDLSTNKKIEEEKNKINKEHKSKIEQLTLDFEIKENAQKEELSNEKDKNKKLNIEIQELKNKENQNKEELKKNELSYNELTKQFEEKESTLKTKISELDIEITKLLNLNTKQATELEKEKIDSSKKIKEITEELDIKTKELEKIKKQNKDKSELRNNMYNKYIEIYSKDEMMYFETIYKNDIEDDIVYKDFLNNVVNKSSLDRITTQYITDKFLEKGFLSINGGHIIYNKKFTELLYKIFTNIKNFKDKRPKPLWAQ